jgi:hypothetical protein
VKAKDITGPAARPPMAGVPPRLPALPKQDKDHQMDPHEEQIFERIVGGQIPAKRIV